jgi:hypothetical protein
LVLVRQGIILSVQFWLLTVLSLFFYPPSMREATPEELIDTLRFALQFKGRKRANHAADFMAQVAAEVLAEHLRLSGYVVMKKPPAPAHSSPTHYDRPKED